MLSVFHAAVSIDSPCSQGNNLFCFSYLSIARDKLNNEVIFLMIGFRKKTKGPAVNSKYADFKFLIIHMHVANPRSGKER